MLENFGFRSIWTKVFGLTAILVTTMLIAASVSFLISYYKVNDVRLRVSHLAHAIVPLNKVAANIDSYSLQEEIQLEQALRRWISNPQAADIYQENVARFLNLEKLVQEELIAAREIIDQTLLDPQWLSPKDAIEFGRITLLLENIEKEHNEFFSNAKDIIQSLNPAAEISIESKIQQLEGEATHLDSQLFMLLSSLEELNSTQAEEIEAAENVIMSIYQQNFFLTLIVFLIGIGTSATITTRLVKPVRELRLKSAEISKGNFDVEVIPSSKDEVGQLALTFNEMSKELKANNQVRELFGKYVDPRIVDSLLIRTPEFSVLDGNKHEMSIFFSDVKGFSTISEMLTAAGLVKLINRYFSIMAEPIVAEKGVIDKYVGDCVMAFWGPPFTENDEHAVRACHAALAQFEQLEKLKAALPEILGFRKGVPDFEIRIGLATGEVLSGNIGSENAKSYTVMGDTVNVASRLESLNKKYGTRILIDELTRARIGETFVAREIDSVTVAGKNEVTRVFELFAETGSTEPQLNELFDHYESGLQAYRNSNWSEAKEKFSACLALNPEDQPTKVMLERIEQLKDDPSKNSWDGVWRFTTK